MDWVRTMERRVNESVMFVRGEWKEKTFSSRRNIEHGQGEEGDNDCFKNTKKIIVLLVLILVLVLLSYCSLLRYLNVSSSVSMFLCMYKKTNRTIHHKTGN